MICNVQLVPEAKRVSSILSGQVLRKNYTKCPVNYKWETVLHLGTLICVFSLFSWQNRQPHDHWSNRTDDWRDACRLKIIQLLKTISNTCNVRNKNKAKIDEHNLHEYSLIVWSQLECTSTCLSTLGGDVCTYAHAGWFSSDLGKTFFSWRF